MTSRFDAESNSPSASVGQDLFEAHARALDDDGFTILRGLFDHADIDHHLRAYESHAAKIDGGAMRDAPVSDLDKFRRAREAFYEADRTHEAICFHPPLLDFLRRRFGAEPVLRMVGTHLYTVGSHIHADSLNTTITDPPQSELRIWAALEDVDPSSGPIYLYPKSHRLISGGIREEMLDENPGYHDWLRFNFRPHTEESKRFGAHMIEKIEAGLFRHRLERVVPELQKGDALIFDLAIIHGSCDAQSPQRTRKCMIFNHYALGAPFYAPGAYWGRTHDYRRPENVITFEIAQSPSGLRVVNYLKTCKEIMERTVVVS